MKQKEEKILREDVDDEGDDEVDDFLLEGEGAGKQRLKETLEKKKEKKTKVLKSDKYLKRPKKRNPVKRSFASFIHKILKSNCGGKFSITSTGMDIVDSFANDLFDQLSTECVKLMRGAGNQSILWFFWSCSFSI